MSGVSNKPILGIKKARSINMWPSTQKRHNVALNRLKMQLLGAIEFSKDREDKEWYLEAYGVPRIEAEIRTLEKRIA